MKRLEYTMLAVFMPLVMILSVIAISGCSTWGNGKVDVPFAESPYQAGRTFVFIDTITEPFQPAEVAAAIDQVYALATVNLDAEDMVDALVRAEIDNMYRGSTPEARAMIFTVYKAVFHRIEYQIKINPDIPRIEVLHEFFLGVEDALAIYQPKE